MVYVEDSRFYNMSSYSCQVEDAYSREFAISIRVGARSGNSILLLLHVDTIFIWAGPPRWFAIHVLGPMGRPVILYHAFHRTRRPLLLLGSLLSLSFFRRPLDRRALQGFVTKALGHPRGRITPPNHNTRVDSCWIIIRKVKRSFIKRSDQCRS